MDEGTSDQGDHWYIKLTETHDDQYIHDTDDDRFDENCRDRSRHLLYNTKKTNSNLSRPPPPVKDTNPPDGRNSHRTPCIAS